MKLVLQTRQALLPLVADGRDLRATPQRDDIPVTMCSTLTLRPEFGIEHTYAIVNFRMQSMAMVDYYNHVLHS